MMHKAWCGIQELPYCFFRSSIKFQGYTGQKINDLNRIFSKITWPVVAIKPLRFALFLKKKKINKQKLAWGGSNLLDYIHHINVIVPTFLKKKKDSAYQEAILIPQNVAIHPCPECLWFACRKLCHDNGTLSTLPVDSHHKGSVV